MTDRDMAHLWVRGGSAAGRAHALNRLDLPETLATVAANRRLRGPYTAAGTLLRRVVPDALERCPEVAAAHDIEILSTTPELRGVLPATRETLTSLAVPRERTRFYSRLRTLRIAHGLTEFLGAYLRSLGDGPRALVVTDLHLADPTDREFVAVLLRRMDPALLTVVLTTDDGTVADPPGPTAVPLGPALEAYCSRVDADEVAIATGPTADAAKSYVDSDGTGTDPAWLAAYEALAPQRRAALHDARAAELTALGEESLRLGAICWHAERGGDPTGAGVAALRHALDYCMDHGFYHAVLDLGARGRALVTPERDLEQWWAFSTKMTTSLSALGRAEEALPIYEQARALDGQTHIHMQAAYATAMLYTRHFAEQRRDHDTARRWAELAIELSGAVSDPKDREFYTAFNRNGLALIEVHQGNAARALELLDACIADLDRTLAPGEQALHRSVLRYNRAQVYAGLRRYSDAVDEYTAVIDVDPNYPEYHFDRGIVRRRIGDDEGALADFDRAIRLSPPFPEAYYNRGDTRALLGDVDGAIADFGYVIELDPDYVDAYVNRAGLLLERGDLAGAWRDVDAGLTARPGDPHLLCLAGQLHAEQGDADQARRALSAALEADDSLAEAWAARGALAFEAGDLTSAIADLERAAERSDDENIRYNLALAYQQAAGA